MTSNKVKTENFEFLLKSREKTFQTSKNQKTDQLLSQNVLVVF